MLNGMSMADALVALALSVLAILAQRYSAWIKSKSLPARAQSAALALGDLMLVSVGAAMQTTVRDLKDPDKPGTWSEKAAAAIRKTVLADVRELGAEQLAVLTEAGYTKERAEKLLDKLLEAAVAKSKGPRLATATLVGDAFASAGTYGNLAAAAASEAAKAITIPVRAPGAAGTAQLLTAARDLTALAQKAGLASEEWKQAIARLAEASTALDVTEKGASER